MRRLFKYKLAIGDISQVQMPKGAVVKHVANQHGDITLWAEIDDSRPLEARRFYIHGTGHEIEDGLSYLGSAQCGPFVWHVYE